MSNVGTMFEHNKTVFILGAGASWHYGYPTGEDLTRKVVAQSINLRTCFENSIHKANFSLSHIPQFVIDNADWQLENSNDSKNALIKAMQDCEAIHDRLIAVDPLVIDFFLGQNEDLANLGRLLIALVLLDCEAKDMLGSGNQNRRELFSRSPLLSDREKVSGLEIKHYSDNWCRFLIHKLVHKCECAGGILRNKVSFVTFNYDVSLEYHLYRGIQSIKLFNQTDEAEQFFQPPRFFHAYGQIRNNAVEAPPRFSLAPLTDSMMAVDDHNSHFEKVKLLLNYAYQASKGIKTMAPGKLERDANVLAACEVIDDADCVYILGYGFDPANNELLDLSNSLSERKQKTVLLTNFNGLYSINKNASRVLFGNPEVLMQRDIVMGTRGGGIPRCEKSVRDVYHALAFDFDHLEEQILPTTAF